MSFIVHFHNGKLTKSETLYTRTIPSPVNTIGSEFYVIGELFENSINSLYYSNWEENPNLINSFNGAFSVVKVSNTSCTVVSDICGLEPVYYYKTDEDFMVSDDIWDIIRVINPSFDDIDQKWVRNTIICIRMDNHTFIKGLSLLRPSTIVKYSADTNSVEEQLYREFRYSREKENVDQAAEDMDLLLKKAFRRIHMQFDSGTVFGVGLSGGLDSRIIPHYAKNEGLDLVAFNICTKRPKGLLLAESCKSAIKMANTFHIPLSLVEWEGNELKSKAELKIRNYPLGSGRNSFKYEVKGLPDFDVLLTGGTGLIVGSTMPANIDTIDKSTLVSYMKNLFIHKGSPVDTISRVKRAINYMLGTKLNEETENRDIIDMFSQEIQEAENEIDSYVSNMLQKGYTNLDIYENYFLNVMGFRNRMGSFESLLGTKRSFSIYVPFLLSETLKWDSQLMENRAVLNTLINKKIPEVAKIPTESFQLAPGLKSISFIKKAIPLVSRLIKGNGTSIDENNYRKRKVKQTIKLTFNNECIWFYSIFDKAQVFRLLQSYNDCAAIINLWEMKELLDYIEKKLYNK